MYWDCVPENRKSSDLSVYLLNKRNYCLAAIVGVVLEQVKATRRQSRRAPLPVLKPPGAPTASLVLNVPIRA